MVKKRKKKSRRKRKIKYLLIAAGCILLLFIFLQAKFFFGEPLYISLSPEEYHLILQNQSEDVYLDITIRNFPLCSARCNFTYHDLAKGEKTTESYIPQRREQITRSFHIDPPHKNGMFSYRYDIVCSNTRSLGCPDDDSLYIDSTFIGVRHNLTDEIRDQQAFFRKNYSLLMAYLDINFKFLHQIRDIISQLPQEVPSDLHQHLSSARIQQNSFDIVLSNAVDLRDRWNKDTFKADFSDHIQKAEYLIQQQNLTLNSIEKIIETYNQALSLKNNLEKQKKKLFEAELFYRKLNGHYPSNEYFIAEQRLESVLDKEIPSLSAINASEDLLNEALALTLEVNHTLQTYNLERESIMLDASTLIRRQQLYFSNLFNETVFTNEFSTNLTKNFSSLCNLSNTVLHKTISHNNIQNATNESLDELEKQIDALLKGIYRVSPLPPNQYALDFPKMILPMSKLNSTTQLVCDLAATLPSQPPDITETINITPTQLSTSINIELDAKPSICCFRGNCSPCCSDCKNNVSLYPTIFIHGHLFNQLSTPEESLNAFVKIMEKMEGSYLNVGDFESNTKADWSYYNKPIIARGTYYYISYVDLGLNTVQARKSERIENYALRLNEIITSLLGKTDRDKVNIVAYSMGGLVARQYLTTFGESQVHKLVTLATPHEGLVGNIRSFCSVVGAGLECEDMSSGSIFLKKLDPIENIQTFTISATGCAMDTGIGDGVVLFNHSRLTGAINYTVAGNCTDFFATDLHLNILDPTLYPQVPQIIMQVLQE